MVDHLTVQLQDLISELRLSKDTDAQNEIKTAKNYVQDADKLKQVRFIHVVAKRSPEGQTINWAFSIVCMAVHGKGSHKRKKNTFHKDGGEKKFRVKNSIFHSTPQRRIYNLSTVSVIPNGFFL